MTGMARQAAMEALAEWDTARETGDDLDIADAGERLADLLRELTA